MEARILLVFCFTVIIHMISTLAYSVRLVGINTGRIAVSLALFNVLALASRMANALQAPFLAKFVEGDVPELNEENIVYYFIFLISGAAVGTLAGGILTPTFQRALGKLVNRFNVDKSVPKLVYHTFTQFGIQQLKDNIAVPSKKNIEHLKDFKKLPRKRIIANSLVVALLTVGSFAALYAAAIAPDLRLTSSAMAPLITGIATVILVVFIDPYFSMLTDDIINGKNTIVSFHKEVVWLVISRFAGSLLALLLFIPCAYFIIWVAKLI